MRLPFPTVVVLAVAASPAAGQPPLVDTILFRREGGSYRIDALKG